MKTFLRYAPVAAILLTLAGCDIHDLNGSERYKEDFHYSYPLSAGGQLSVETSNGGVEIASWDRNTVEINGTKYASTQESLKAIKIDISAQPNSVRVRTIPPSGWHNSGARYTIHVPRSVNLDQITTSNGGIRVEDIDGTARLKTSNGGIHEVRSKGELTATTSNGGIDVEGHEGNVHAHTTNGHVNVEAAHGSFEAETSNGSIEAHLRDPNPGWPIKAGSSNGHIDLTLDASKLPDVRATTSNSSILLRLPAKADARLRATTSNSSITNEFEITIPPGEHSKHHLEGTIGAGGPSLELSSSNGSIKILKM